MKASDYIAEFLVNLGVKHIFGITGGAIVHTFDSIGKRKDIEYICTQHEQAAAMAADGYSRITKNIGVTVTTSGPGATNLLTGTCCSYYDSIPILNITGQVATNRLRGDKGVRQIGFQETPISKIYKPVTKYSVLVDNPKMLRYELEKAAHIAKSGRPGPVLVDIPDDIQRADINPDRLPSYIPEKISVDYAKIKEQAMQCVELINNSERPIIVLGAGVKLSGCEEEAMKFVRNLKIPVALTWATRDLFLEDNELNAGGFGITSQRYGNFAIQNSDLVLALGTRMDTHHTGTPLNMFAREAKKVILDIDNTELEKFRGSELKWDVSINADVKDFFMALQDVRNVKEKNLSGWLDRIKEWKDKYPPYKESAKTDYVDSYAFLEVLSKESLEGDIIITDAGGNLAQTMGGYRFRKKQTLFSAFNHSPMGNSLPESIGACFANDKRPVVCIIGDGGIQMNIQELATIKYHNLPIKIFVFNNKGYGMIQQTQDDWLNSRYEASDMENGIPVPDFVKIGNAYGLKTERIKNNKQLASKLKNALRYDGPVLCDVNISPDQRTVPMLKVGRPIEDAKPLLSREEFLENMIVKPAEQSLKGE
ncbi:MAG: thiamine pyrophosphate-binding protein [Candidatus Pacearchaeota archaeon]|nr:thiamine pyrophosphate-binding protein [Candidatus Pacearchaeota archaeon]